MDDIDQIIAHYKREVQGIEHIAIHDAGDRAYGGIIRSSKGKFVEVTVEKVIRIAWSRLGYRGKNLEVVRKAVQIPLKREYLDKIDQESVRNFLRSRINSYYYSLAIDRIVLLNHNPIIAIECKAYTENAMLKRILVDCSLLKSIYPDLTFVLFQLESQLGGDYSELKKYSLGSPSTHTLLSHFDIDLHIVTLLKGERKVDRPIHKEEFFKPLTRESLENAVHSFVELFQLRV